MKAIGNYDVTSNWMASMTQCLCGDVFEASGAPDEVNRQQKDWDARHAHCEKPVRTGAKTFYMSFCDGDRPTGEQFLGACVVDVTAAEADECEIDVLLRFPFAQPGAEWLAAATKKAHRLGCNPGGEIASMEVEPDNPNLAYYERGVLMDRATLTAIDQRIEAATKQAAVDPVGDNAERDPTPRASND